jgi:hypothetical protein
MVHRMYTPADLSTDAARLGARHDGIVARRHGSGYLWYGPYTTLPPGNHTVTIRLNVRRAAPNDAVRVEVVAGSVHQTVADTHVNDTTGWTPVRLSNWRERGRMLSFGYGEATASPLGKKQSISIPCRASNTLPMGEPDSHRRPSLPPFWALVAVPRGPAPRGWRPRRGLSRPVWGPEGWQDKHL